MSAPQGPGAGLGSPDRDLPEARVAAHVRVPALDGVRGLAVVAVLLFHAGVPGAATGWLGVDAFFVLSGFLITSLLVQERERTGRVHLPTFWVRRARRLLPALLVLVTAVLVHARLTNGGSPQLRDHALATLGYAENWHLLYASDGGYFAEGAPPSLLRHAWSLSVEEQFYLAWPVLAAVVLARGGDRRLLRLAVAGAVASAAWAGLLLATGASQDRLHLGTDTRAQGLLIGAAAAVVLDRAWVRRSPRVVGLLGAGVALTAGAVLALGAAEAAYAGGLFTFCLGVAAVLVAVSLAPRSGVARPLSWRPLVVLGGLSYSLYLWHWPVYLTLTGARTGLTGPALLALRVGVSLGLAALSLRLVEEPFRTGALSSPRRVLLAVPAATVAVAAAAVLVSVVSPPSRTVRDEPDLAALVSRQQATATPPATPTPRPVIRSRGTGPVRVLVVGDSVALTLTDALPTAPSQILLNGGALGCGLLDDGQYRYAGRVAHTPPHCSPTAARWAALARTQQADVVAVLVGRWEVMDRKVDGRWVALGDPAYDTLLRGRFHQALTELQATGAQPVLLTAPYSRRSERPDGGLWPEDTERRVDRWNALLKSVASAERVPLVDLGARTARSGRYTNRPGGVRLRYDGLHISPAGGRWLAPWLLPRLVSAAPSR